MRILNLGRALASVVLLGSFMNLSSAEEKGTVLFTFAYIAFAMMVATLFIFARLNKSAPRWSQSELIYIALLILLLIVNFFVATSNELSMRIWASRAMHIPMTVVFLIIFRLGGLSVEQLMKMLFYLGMIEMGIICFSFLSGSGVDAARATDIDGVIIYSVLLVVSGFLSLHYYNSCGKSLYLLLYFAVLMATVLTGTRGLIVSVAIQILVLRLSWVKVVMFVFAMLGTYYMLVAGFLERFNISDQDNLITVLSKFEELQILWNFFMSSPLWGVGFGTEFQTSTAASPYTYSHNALLFYLGYGGLLALPALIAPLYSFLRTVPKGYLMFTSVMLFYTTSTTFTQLKHSLVMAAFVFIGARLARQRLKNNCQNFDL